MTYISVSYTHLDVYKRQLVKTSNPSSGEFQDRMIDGRPLYEWVGEKVAEWGADCMGDSYLSLIHILNFAEDNGRLFMLSSSGLKMNILLLANLCIKKRMIHILSLIHI